MADAERKIFVGWSRLHCLSCKVWDGTEQLLDTSLLSRVPDALGNQRVDVATHHAAPKGASSLILREGTGSDMGAAPNFRLGDFSAVNQASLPTVIRGTRYRTNQDSKDLALPVIQVGDRIHDHTGHRPSPLSGDISNFKWLVKLEGKVQCKMSQTNHSM